MKVLDPQTEGTIWSFFLFLLKTTQTCTNKVFCGASGRIQNDLIHAIGDVMGEEIKKEVHKAPFVAVMLGETTDVSNTAQLGARVKERFVTFENVTSCR